MVRGTREGRDDLEFFTDRSVVAVNWSEVNLSDPSPAVVEQALDLHEAGRPKNIVAKKRGEIRRFREIAEGDRLLIPFRRGVALAISSGRRRYDEASQPANLANQIEVEFLLDDGTVALIPRGHFSEEVQRKLRGKGTTISALDDYSNELERLFARFRQVEADQKSPS